MTKQDHIDYLKQLEKDYGKGAPGFGCVVPKMEGAFYFGDLITYDEYVDKYRQAVQDMTE